MENEKTELRQLTMNCKFCGSTTIEMSASNSDDDMTIDVRSCKRCIPPLRKGTKVRYAAARRAPGDALYADAHLTRNSIYTIARHRQHQHGAYIELAECPSATFNVSLFTPEDFTEEARS